VEQIDVADIHEAKFSFSITYNLYICTLLSFGVLLRYLYDHHIQAVPAYDSLCTGE
jgi:hypothetical protein